MPNATKNTENIEACRDNFLKAAGLLQAVIDGKAYQTEAGDAIGIDRKNLQYQVIKQFLPYIKHSVMSVPDILSRLDACRTPGDRLVLRILNLEAHKPDAFVALPDYDEDALWDAAEAALTPREFDVMAKLCGYFGDEPMEARQVARERYVTQERIRQIEAKALRKCRSHKVLRAAFPCITVQAADCIDHMLDAADKAMDRYRKARTRYANMKALCAATDVVEECERRILDCLPPGVGTASTGLLEASGGVSLERLCSDGHMSLRLYHVLTRAGYNALNQIAGRSRLDAMAIRNMGRSSLTELEGLLEKFGLPRLKDE